MLLTKIDVIVKSDLEKTSRQSRRSWPSNEFSSWRQTTFSSCFSRERREAEQRERQEKERRERERQERERAERERREREQKSAVEAVDHHFQLSIELAKKVLIYNSKPSTRMTTLVLVRFSIEKLDQTCFPQPI